MPKGKFGFSLWLYPFIALWTVLVGPALAGILILGFVALAEKDEWVIQQCIHAVMFGIYWSVYRAVIGFLTGIPLLGTVISVIDGIVFVVMMALVLYLGLSRLKNGQDIGLPGKGIVMRAYGLVRSIPTYQSIQAAAPAPSTPSAPAPAEMWAGAPYREQPYVQPPSPQPRYSEEPPRGYEQPPAPYAPPPRAPEPDGGGLKPPPPPPSF